MTNDKMDPDPDPLKITRICHTAPQYSISNLFYLIVLYYYLRNSIFLVNFLLFYNIISMFHANENLIKLKKNRLVKN